MLKIRIKSRFLGVLFKIRSLLYGNTSLAIKVGEDPPHPLLTRAFHARIIIAEEKVLSLVLRNLAIYEELLSDAGARCRFLGSGR